MNNISAPVTSATGSSGAVSEHFAASTADPASAEAGEVDLQLRPSTERPTYKLSVRLIDTYKYINKVYYEAKAQKLKDQKDSARGGVHNDGYDDQNYDYILQGDEILQERYILKHRMGKGSFGQVVCAYDRERKCEVAIKIIKSRRPFLIQARTEIEILNKVLERDRTDESNIVRLLDQFMYRNHQCLVFEILSFNLYELLKNTKFRGVSLSLIRKFSRHLLKSLEFLNRDDVNIIHCDLKPENILLRHPRRSAIKLIDFGSSCYLSKRTYSYIQSRFYRSPEVLLGLPYTQKIDLWSLGCVVVEMHTGEPLFGGTNQVDQMCRIVDVLGMPPLEMIKASPEKTRTQFFEQVFPGTAEAANLPTTCDPSCSVFEESNAATGSPCCFYVLKRPQKDTPKPRSLADIIGVRTGGPSGRRINEPDHTPLKYEEFLDFVSSMLRYIPTDRPAPHVLSSHPYLIMPEVSPPAPPSVAQQQQQQQAFMPPQPPATASAVRSKPSSAAPMQLQQPQQQQLASEVDVPTNSTSSSQLPPPPAAVSWSVSKGTNEGSSGNQLLTTTVPWLKFDSQTGTMVPDPGAVTESSRVVDVSTLMQTYFNAATAARVGNSGSGEPDSTATSAVVVDSSSQISSKDVSRGRRGDVPVVNKIRSSSAPGGSQSHVRLFPDSSAAVPSADTAAPSAAEAAQQTATAAVSESLVDREDTATLMDT